ncbi:hypothetical protein ACLOJK_009028 [Asimina triloba]
MMGTHEYPVQRRQGMSIVQHAVSSVIKKLGEALVGTLIDEAIFLHGVSEQVQWMEAEFTRMQCFLKDADAKQLADERVKNWVLDVQEVAQDAEDAIDTFAYEIAPLRMQRGVFRTIKRYASSPTELKALHKLGNEIERIKVKIKAISDSRGTYGIDSIGQGEVTTSAAKSLQNRRLSSPDIEEPDFNGFEEETKSLIEQLIQGDRDRRCFLSLVGMGGLGKTTLAKKAYNHIEVKKNFNARAWVSVSQQYSVRELFLVIGKCCSACSVDKLERMADIELRNTIHENLKGRRYLIVLDDMWDYEAWDSLKEAFPDESNGSRVLLTTRNKDVALYADARSKPHELRFLTEDESWQLFCKKAFPGQEIKCPCDLEPIGREIVKHCGGLPLTIIVMGGLLSRKEAREWHKVLKSIRWQFREGQYRINEILSLSYYDLPYNLKPCFLYLSVFPEDYEFPANQLIEMWAAEGFLQERGDETAEEVGEDILTELVARCMIQVAERDYFGRISTCRIHDLLRELAKSKGEKDKFVEVNASGACRARRLAIHMNVTRYDYFKSSASHLRCLFCLERCDVVKLESRKQQVLFMPCSGQRFEQEKILFTRFILLRVLCLEAVAIKDLPSDIGRLVHLRYLSCNTYMKSLPSSMANLHHLQSLYLRASSGHGIIRIPSVVQKKLQQLRHLRLESSLYGTSFIKRRQFKHYLSSNLFDTVEKFHLEVLYVEKMTLDCCIESSSVSDLYLIPKSSVANSSSSMPLSLQRPFLTQHQLYLRGKIQKLPDIRDFPSNLSDLKLEDFNLKQDPLPLLGKLENLTHLVLMESVYLGNKMTCSAGGFPRLVHFRVNEDHLEELIVEEGSMPSLRCLFVDECKRLKMIPDGLKYLTTLHTLKIQSMPQQFTNRLQSEIGEDWHKIQHVPRIVIS